MAVKKKTPAKTTTKKSATRRGKQSSGQTARKSASASVRSGAVSSFVKEKTFNNLKTSPLASAGESSLEINDAFCKIATAFLPFDATGID